MSARRFTALRVSLFAMAGLCFTASLPHDLLGAGFTIQGATVTFAAQARFSVDGDLAISHGGLTTNGAAISVGGSLVSTGTFSAAASTVTLTGSATGNLIKLGRASIFRLAVTGSGEWSTFGTPVTVSSSVAMTAGTLTVAAGSTMTVAGTIDVGGSATLAINNDLRIGGGSLTNAGTVTSANPSALLTLVGGGTLGGAGSTTVPGLSLPTASQTTLLTGPLAVTGALTNSASHTLDANGSGNYDISVGSGLLNSGTLLNRANTVTFTGASANSKIQTNNFPFNNLVINGVGSWMTQTNPVTVSGLASVSAGTLKVVAGSTLTVQGSMDVGAAGQLVIQTDVLLNNGTLTNSGSISSVSTATVTLNGNGALGGSGSTVLPKLTLVGNSLTTTLYGPVSVTGKLTNPSSHILDVNDSGSFALTISSDFANSGNFVPQSGEVIFAGTSTLSGQTTFYNLTAATPGITLTFPAGSTQTISNTLQFTGGASNLIRIRSTTPGSQAYLKLEPAGNASIYGVDVQDSNASGQTLTASASTARTNNTNWIFGTTRTWLGTTASWNTATNWSPSGVPGENDTVVFSNAANCTVDLSTTVALVNIQGTYSGTITASQNLTTTGGYTQAGGTFNAGSSVLTVGASWAISGGTFNPGTGTVLFNSQSAGRTLQTNHQSFNNVTFNGSGGYWTMQDSMTVVSTMTLSAGALDTKAANGFGIAVRGSWWGSGGTFVANTSTVTFNGTTAGQKIDSGNSPFYRLNIAGSGAWSTDTSALTVSSTVFVNAGTLTVTSGSTMTVVGGMSVISGAALAINGDLEVRGGGFTNAGTVTSNSAATFSLSGTGTLGGSGSLRLPIVSLSGNAQTTTLGGPLSASGLITNGAGHTLDANNSGNYAITVSSAWANAGTFVARTSSVSFNGSGSGLAIDAGPSPFYKLALTGSGGWTTANTPVTVSSTIVINSGTFTIAAGATTTVAGSLTVNSGATLMINSDLGIAGGTLSNAGTVRSNSAAVLRVSGNGTLGGAGSTILPIVTLSGTSTSILNGPLSIQGLLTVGAGHTLDANSSGNYALTLSDSWLNSGTFTARASSVTFNGSGTGLTIDNGASPFYTLAFTGSGAWATATNPLTVSSTVVVNTGTFTLAPSSSMTVAGNLTIGVAGSLVMNADLGVNGGTVSNAGSITSDAATVFTSSGTGFLGGSGTALWPNIVFAGSARTTTLASALVLQGNLTNNTGHTFDPSSSNFPITVGGSWSNAGSYVTRTSSISFNGSSTGQTIQTGNSPLYKLAITGSGDWATSTHPVTVSSTVVVSAGSLTVASGSTMTVVGSLDVQSGALLALQANLAVQGGSLTNQGTISAVSGSTVSLSGSGSLGGSGSMTLSALTLSGNAQTTTLAGALTLAGAFTNNSGHTLDVDSVGNYSVTVSSDWTNSGTLTPRTGTVEFTSTATIRGNTSFYNLTAITSGITLTFVSGSTQTVTGKFFVNGANGDLITLKSSTGGTQFYVNSTGLADLLYLSVQDSKATGNVLNASASNNVGNNTRWTFGTTKTWTGGGANNNWNTSANWSPAGAPGALDSVVFTTPASRNCTVNISTTIAQLTIQSNFPTNRTITVSAGITLTVSGDFTQAAGTLTFSGATPFTVGGSWEHQAGVINLGKVPVVFDASSPGQTIRSGGRSFNNIVFSGSGGVWTLQDPLVVQSSVAITAGTLDTNPSGSYAVSVGTDWINTGGNFIGNQSTVTFNATASGRQIVSGGSAFPNLNFNGSGPVDWTLGDALTASNITLTSGTLDTYALGNYPVTVTENASWTGGNLRLNFSSFTVLGNWSRTGTSFDLGASTVAFPGSGSHVLDSGGQDFYNLTFANSGGQWSTMGSSLTVQNAFSVQAGTFTLTSVSSSTLQGTVAVNAGATWVVNSSVTLTAGSLVNNGVLRTDVSTASVSLIGNGSIAGTGSTVFPNLLLAGPSQTTTLAGDVTVSNLLTVNPSHTLDGASQTLTLTGVGTPLVVNGSWTPSASTVVYAPSSAGTVNVAPVRYATVNFNRTASSFLLSGPLSTSGDLNISAGTLDVTGSDYPITIGGTWNNADHFSAHAGSVTFQSSSSGLSVNAGSSSFYKVAFQGSGDWSTAGGPVTVSSTMVLNSGTVKVVAGSTLTVGGPLTVASGSTLDLQSDLSAAGGTLSNGGLLTSISTATLRLSGTGTLGGAGVTRLPILSLSGSGETTTLAGPVTVQASLSNGVGHVLDADAIGNFGMTISSGWANAGTFTARASSVSFNGATTNVPIASGGSPFYRLTFTGSGSWVTATTPLTVSSQTILNSGVLTIAAASTMTVVGDLLVQSGATLNLIGNLGVTNGALSNSGTLSFSGLPTLTLSGDGSLGGGGTNTIPRVSFSGSGTTTLTGAIAASGLLQIGSGHTLDVGLSNYTITTSSSWLNSGTFTPRAGAVSFTSNADFNGQTTFNDFTATTPGITLTFAAASTQTVSGVFTITGISGNTVKLRSSVNLQPFFINNTGSASVTFANVKDSYASGNTINASASTNAGGNTNWTFGTNYVWLGPGNFSDASKWSPSGNPGPLDSVRYNNGNNCTVDISTTITSFTIDSSYSGSISDDQPLVLLGGFNQAGGTFLLNTSTLTVGSNWNITGGTFNPGTAAVLLNASTIGRSISSNGQTFYNLVLNGSGGYWTMQDSMTVISSMTFMAGTLDTGASGNYGILIGRDWINTGGTFVAQNSTVTFSSSNSGRRIVSGNQPFANVVFSGAGTWTSTTDPLTASGLFTLSNNATVVPAGSSTMTVAGVVVNSGSTLTLNNDFQITAGGLANAGTVTAASTTTLLMAGTGSLGGSGVTRLATLLLSGNAQATTLGGPITVQGLLSNGAGHVFDANNTGNFSVTVSSAWANAGTYVARTSSVSFNGSGLGLAIDSGGSSFYKLALTGSGTWMTANTPVTVSSTMVVNSGSFTIASGATTTVAGTLTVNAGAALVVNSDLGVQGGSINNSGTVTSLSGSVVTLSNGGVLGGSGNALWPDMTFAGNATTTLASALTLQGTLTNSSGHTLSPSGSNYSLTLGGSWSNSGTFSAQTSSVTFNGSGSGLTINNGSSSFYKLAFTGSGGWASDTNPLTISSTVVVNTGTFTLAPGSSMTVAGNLTIGVAGSLVMNADLGVNGGTVSNSGSITSDASTVFTSSGTGTLGGSGTALWPNIVFAGSARTTTLASALVLQGNLTNNTGHTFDPSSSNFPITVGGSWSNAGSYVTRTSSISFNGSSTGQTIQTGNSPLYKLAITGSGDWATSTHPVTVSSTVVVSAGSLTVASGSTMTVVGSLDVQSGALLALQANLAVQGGSLTNAGNVTAVSGSTLTLSGSGTLGGSGVTSLFALTLSGTSQSTTLGGAISLDGKFTNSTNHTFDANGAGNYAIAVSSDWTNNGNFLPRNGTVVFDSTATLTGNTTFYNLTAMTSGITLTFVVGSTQTITGTLTLNGGSGDLLTLKSSSNGNQFYINSTGSADLLYLSVRDSKATGNILNASASTNVSNNVNWTFGTSRTWTGGGGTTSWNLSTNWSPSGIPTALDSVIFNNSATRNCVVTITTTVAQMVIQSNFSRTITFNAGVVLSVSGDFSQAAGTLNFNNPVTLEIGGNWTNTGGSFTPGAGKVVFNANSVGQTITPNGRNFNNVEFNGSGGYWTLQGSMTVVSSMTVTAGTLDTGNYEISVGADWLNNGGAFVANQSTVTFTSTSAGRQITSGSATWGTLTFNGSGGAWTLQDDMSIGGNLTLAAGTLNGGSATISVTGDWNASGGSYSAGTSTVTFTGVSGSVSTVSGTNAFANLSCSVPGKILKFAATATQSVTGQLTLQGTVGTLLQLRSTVDLVPWSLNLSGAQSIAYVDVKNSNASGLTLYTDKTSLNVSGNTNWVFTYLPQAILDFSATALPWGDVALSWSAPLDADDNPLGVGSRYAIEWSTYSVNWSTTTTADTGYVLTSHVYISTSAVSPSDAQVYVSTGLRGNTDYYFRIWTQDPQGYWSAGLSNGATATVTAVLSVTLDTSTYDFGGLTMNSIVVSSSPIALTNTGNVAQTYSLSASTLGPTTVWLVGTSTPTAHNQFAVFGLFNTAQPSATTFLDSDIVTTTPTPASATEFSGDLTGLSVLPGVSIPFWMRLDMPPTTATQQPQQFQLSFTASSP